MKKNHETINEIKMGSETDTFKERGKMGLPAIWDSRNSF
jgi:hypothetical protein